MGRQPNEEILCRVMHFHLSFKVVSSRVSAVSPDGDDAFLLGVEFVPG